MKLNSLLKLKKHLILMFLLGIAILTNAQNTVSGTVTDAVSQNPLIGVNILVSELNNGTITDIDGSYSINLPDGTYNIVASYIGYSYQSSTITVSGGQTVTQDFGLTAGTALDEVMITASSTFRSQKEAPLSISAIKQAEITKMTPNSQADILRNIPGITVEGGGGETATNLRVRGLPSGGQFTYNPLQYDGLPLMTSFGLNSSAHDVYARPDIGFKGVEFVRGGASIMYGAGSAAGVINYISKTGDANPGNIVNVELGSAGRIKTDLYSGGRLGGENSNTYYAITGFLRYDEGPYKTGIPTQGGQLRANVKNVFKKGSFTVHTQYINDRAQFLMPLPLEGGSRERLNGNDGEPVSQLMTGALANTSFLTAGGEYKSPYEDGVYTKGGYVMGEFEYNLASDLKFKAKTKMANYAHSFALYVGGNGVNGGNPLTLAEYMAIVAPTNIGYTGKYHSGPAVGASDLIIENQHVDRIRPMTDYAGEASLSKRIATSGGSHNLTLGTFIGRSEADDINYQYRVVSEFNNNPRLVDITFMNPDSTNVVHSINGVKSRIGMTANDYVSQNRTAFYLTDEIVSGKWRFDLGFRFERNTGSFSRGSRVKTQVYDDPALSPDLANVQYATGSHITADIDALAWAASAAALYQLSKSTNVYVNLSRGYYFPQFRTLAPVANGVTGTAFKPEVLLQGEAGVKFGNDKLSGSAALYYVTLLDRITLIQSFANNVLTETRRDNTTTATVGLEAYLDYKLTKDFSIVGNLTYQQHEITENLRTDLLTGEETRTNEGNELARQPNLMGLIGLYYNNNKFDANVNVNYIGSKFTNDDNKIELDPYSLIRMGAGYTMKVGENGENFRLGFNIFNVTDSQGITEGDPRNLNQTEEAFFFGRPELPRRFFVTGTLNF